MFRIMLLALLTGCAAPGGSTPDGSDLPGSFTPIDDEDGDETVQGHPRDQAPDDEEDTGPSDFDLCFQALQAAPGEPAPDYDQFGPVIGSHCNGTDHQNIQGIERVVFVGDSVTVGTPPTGTNDMYRNRLAASLVAKYNLQPPGTLWKNVNLFDGTTIIQDSGAFSSCAKWGARADDLLLDNTQLEDCFPASKRDKTTLVVMTMGGNDLANLTEGFMEGRTHAELWDQTRAFMDLNREAVEWLTDGKFPNGVYVIFTNLYEFTDGTGDVTACPTAGLGGFTAAVDDPQLAEMVVWSMEEYMSIAVDTQTDMLFLLENFCGHGFNHDDPNGRCYRGPSAELWFDLSCTHPNPKGHAVIADMFSSVIDE